MTINSIKYQNLLDMMKTAVYYKNSDIRLEEQPTPELEQGEVLVKVMASGICGSDVMEWYRIKKAPLVLGHETWERAELDLYYHRFCFLRDSGFFRGSTFFRDSAFLRGSGFSRGSDFSLGSEFFRDSCFFRGFSNDSYISDIWG